MHMCPSHLFLVLEFHLQLLVLLCPPDGLALLHHDALPGPPLVLGRLPLHHVQVRDAVPVDRGVGAEDPVCGKSRAKFSPRSVSQRDLENTSSS